MTHLDLFSGIGGFALAAKWAGFETVAFCEIEEYPRKVLRKNFPGVPIHLDVRDINGEDYRETSLITGGYPCQPFSLAGKRKGKEDNRHLWPEMLRIIKQARPPWLVAENVAGHVSMGLDQVLFDLESEGYASRPFVIPACAVDAPHRRDRVWIIANSGGEQYQSGGYEEQWKSVEKLPEDVSNTTRELWNRGRTGTEQTGIGESPNGCRWPAEPGICRVANGIPRRVDRLKGLGNAIVPQVACQILKQIRECSYESLFSNPHKKETTKREVGLAR